MTRALACSAATLPAHTGRVIADGWWARTPAGWNPGPQSGGDPTDRWEGDV